MRRIGRAAGCWVAIETCRGSPGRRLCSCVCSAVGKGRGERRRRAGRRAVGKDADHSGLVRRGGNSRRRSAGSHRATKPPFGARAWRGRRLGLLRGGRDRTVPGAVPRGEVAALDRGNGRPLWRQALPSRPLSGALAIDGEGRIIVVLDNGQALCLDSSDRVQTSAQNQLWKIAEHNGILETGKVYDAV